MLRILFYVIVIVEPRTDHYSSSSSILSLLPSMPEHLKEKNLSGNRPDFSNDPLHCVHFAISSPCHTVVDESTTVHAILQLLRQVLQGCYEP